MKNLTFRQQYQRLPRLNNRRIMVRNRIMEQCQVSLATFYNWYNCLTKIPEHHKPLIADIMELDMPVLFPANE